MKIEEHAVLVVGAGPAGAAAGISLARAGVDVCVVDRARFPRPKPCGDAISNHAVALVAELGAGEALRAAPQARVDSAAVIFPDGSRVRRSYAAAPGMIVRREDLDLLLRDRLVASGARLVEGAAVRELTARDGRFDGAAGDGHRWRARAVIAADGVGSVAWRALGRPHPRGRRLGLAATAYFADVAPGERGAESEHYLLDEVPCGYGWVFPVVDGLTNAGVFQRADRYHRGALPLRDKLARFIRGNPRLRGARRVGEVRVSSLPYCARPAPPGAPGLLCCGDAGGVADPLTGEGIWQALRSGIMAAQLTAAALAAGGLDTRWARRYQRACAREIGWASWARAGAQEALAWLVDRRLYRFAVLRGLLQWGYGRGTLELSKSLG